MAIANHSPQPLPAGDLTLVANREFVLRTKLPELKLATLGTPAAIVRYPNTRYENITVFEEKPPIPVSTGHRICEGVLSYSIANRKIRFRVDSKGGDRDVLFVRPDEPGWRGTTQVFGVGHGQSPETFFLVQDAVDPPKAEIKLATADLNRLKALNIRTDDPIGKSVNAVIQLREKIDVTVSRRTAQEARLAALCQCACQCTTVKICDCGRGWNTRCPHPATVVACGHIPNCVHKQDCDKIRGEISELGRAINDLRRQVDAVLREPGLCPDIPNSDVYRLSPRTE